MSITVEARESVGLEPGAYEGKITELIEETGQYGDQIKFVIAVDSPPQDQWAWASKTLSPQSKLWKWIKAVTGQTPQIGAAFDVEDAMLGQRVGFLVSVNDTGRSVVTDMFRAKGGGARAAAAPPAEAEVCCIPKCGRPYAMFDSDGLAFCEKHAPAA